MANFFYKNDIPADIINIPGDIAVDTETTGLNIFQRDRLCVVQFSFGDGNAHIVQIDKDSYHKSENLKKLLGDASRQFIFHFARFDIAVIKIFLETDIANTFCTKIASKLCRTFTDRHGLKDLCRDILNVELSKQQQCSDWGSELTEKQLEYAANDVLHLHRLRAELIASLARENRTELAQKCFDFLPTRVQLDIHGWPEADIFSHAS